MAAHLPRPRHVVLFAAFFPVTVISSGCRADGNTIGLVSELTAYQRAINSAPNAIPPTRSNGPFDKMILRSFIPKDIERTLGAPIQALLIWRVRVPACRD
jgi:hypothetical protein